MNSLRLGDISLHDYRKLVEPRPWRRAKNWVLGAAGLGLCVLCMAAGDYLGPWTGKNSLQLSPEQALALLQATPGEPWGSELGMKAAFRYAESALDEIRDVAERNPRDSEYASVYILNLSLRGIQHLAQLRDQGVQVGQQQESLRQLGAAAGKN